MALTLTAIVGNRVRLLRRRTGKTQDEVAAAARDCGLGWGRSTVAGLEDGSKHLSAEELVLLPFVFLRAFDYETDVASLVIPMDTDPPGGWIDLTPEARLTPNAIAELLEGTQTAKTTNRNTVDLPCTREMRRAQAEAIERLKGYRQLWPGTSLHRLELAERDAGGEAEQKAARRLGVQAAEVAVAAHRLWGRGLTAERERRVAERGDGRDARSLQAARGHITRTLLAELRLLLEAAGLIDKED